MKTFNPIFSVVSNVCNSFGSSSKEVKKSLNITTGISNIGNYKILHEDGKHLTSVFVDLIANGNKTTMVKLIVEPIYGEESASNKGVTVANTLVVGSAMMPIADVQGMLAEGKTNEEVFPMVAFHEFDVREPKKYILNALKDLSNEMGGTFDITNW